APSAQPPAAGPRLPDCETWDPPTRSGPQGSIVSVMGRFLRLAVGDPALRRASSTGGVGSKGNAGTEEGEKGVSPPRKVKPAASRTDPGGRFPEPREAPECAATAQPLCGTARALRIFPHARPGQRPPGRPEHGPAACPGVKPA